MKRYKVEGHRVNIYLHVITQVIPKPYNFNPTGVNIFEGLNDRLGKSSCVTCERHSNNPYYRSHAAVCLHLKCKHNFAYNIANISPIDMKSTPCIDSDLMIQQLKYKQNQ